MKTLLNKHSDFPYSYKNSRFLMVLFIILSILPLNSEAANMEDYCLVPPYVKKNVPPNIMILMDNSQDMLNAAYGSTYDPNKTYIGYFKSNKYYRYSGQTFQEATGCTSPGPDCYPGNLMNWATMSRFDLLQKVLLGGKTASRQANAHTLSSISGSWTKTYNNCTFSVSNANLTISGSTCGILGGSGGGGSCPSPSGNCSTDTNFPCSTGSASASKSPSIITPSSSSLPDAEVGICYKFTFEAKWGMPVNTPCGGSNQPSCIARYTWNITAGSLPPGLYLDQASGIIYGSPTSTGTWSFTVQVRDTAGQTDSKTVTIQVKSPTVSSKQFNVKVDLPEEPLTDSNGNDIWDPGESFTDQNGNGQWDGKKGVIQEFWDDINPRARWGLTDFFGTTPRIDVETCIPASPASSFYTAIQNATPAPASALAKGLYGITHYFINTTSGRPEYDSNAYHGCTNRDPIDNTPCRLNFILLITSGSNLSGPTLPNLTGPTNTCNASTGTCFVNNAQWAFLNDLRNDKNGKQFISLYVVHTFGNDQTRPYLEEAALKGGGKFYPADENNLEEQLRQALQDILRRAASGTAASVLASGEGQGANLIQAVFYPRTTSIQRGGIFDREISWIGRLSNYWYFVDPLFAQSTIVEDSNQDRKLRFLDDKKITMRFDPSLEATFADLYDYNSIQNIYNPSSSSSVIFERTKVLWEAGLELWKRDINTSPRRIFTSCLGGTCQNNMLSFSEGNASQLRPYLAPGDLNGDLQINDNDAITLINYMNGREYSFLRSRTVAIDLNGDGDVLDSGEEPKVWKLGDVLNSTPKVMSWIPLNSYHQKYGDTTYEQYLNSTNYRQRGIVFAGGNDGMLHAFKLGRLEFPTSETCSSDYKACLSGSELGKELWAFIPKHVLPYLKYYADPGYCHIYSVDLTPYIFDASINNPANCIGDYWTCDKTPESWRTIVIGGMRFGGACRNVNASCTDCVKTPETALGYSSYFALDVTDPDNPVLLWEFARDDLGFTTSGPAIIRVGEQGKNGRWFVVFGSGPTGPIDTVNQQFLGRSDQNLKIFILDLKNGPKPNNLWVLDTNITNAFSGSLLNSVMDTDRDYQDDVVYIPYVKRASDNTFTQGGILRLITMESIGGAMRETMDVSRWSFSTVIDNIGPVTSAVANLLNKKTGKLWLYAGTGRYFYSRPDDIDDATGQRHIVGFTEPCYNNGWSGSCLNDSSARLRTLGQLTDVTDRPEGTDDPDGWYIRLDREGNYTYCERYNSDGSCALQITRQYMAERVITDPLTGTIGVVFFTAYKPYNDICSLGGKSFLWAVKYDTGGAPGGLLKGVGILQVSTGAIEQIDLSRAFTAAGGRKSYSLEGVPPVQQGLSIMTSPAPVKRIIHVRER
ncbi:MAG: PilC/PilY family type IV pilus protein [Thermodesulfovibrionales bacterium]|nr:PilC/PilY family type IV pilus protein [Thermodesulfovibrionales bacterium]